MQDVTPVEAGAAALRRDLERIPHARPCDRPRVERALAGYLGAIGLEPRPVRWIEGDDAVDAARKGFLAFWGARYRKGRPEGPGMTRTEAHFALRGGGLRAKGLIGAALKEEKAVGHRVRHEARGATFGFGDLADGGRAKVLNVEVVSEPCWLGRAMGAVEAALAEKGIHESGSLVAGQQAMKHEQAMEKVREEVQVGAAAAQALEAANWLARAEVLRAAGQPTEEHDRVVAAFLPLVEATKAGLWLFWVTETEVLAVAAPPE